MTTTAIKKAFLDRFMGQGFTRIPPMSMLSKAFPTNFTPSGGEEPLAAMLSGELPQRSVCTVQPCFRYQDIHPEGSRVHLPFFHMGVAISVDDRSIARMAAEQMGFLLTLGLDMTKFKVTVFAGGVVAGIDVPVDAEARDAWLALGIQESQIEFLDAGENFFLSAQQGYAGTKTELFYPLDDGLYLELGVLIRLTHVLADSDLLGPPFDRTVTCMGLGLERLGFVLGDQDSIEAAAVEVADNRNASALELRLRILERGIAHLYRDGASLQEVNRARTSVLRRIIKTYLRMVRVVARTPNGDEREWGLWDLALAPQDRNRLKSEISHVANHLQRNRHFM